jgi:hypothetical protein
MTRKKFYLVHWNIKGNNRNKKDTFKSVIDEINKKKLSVILCVNEINNKFIRNSFSNIILQGLDSKVSGGVKKSNIIVCLNNNINKKFYSKEFNSVNFIGQGLPSFKYRVVKASLNVNNKMLTIITIHSPAGSVENQGVSGTIIKAKFYALLLTILKREKPDIITMDGNEPEIYDSKISKWVFFNNRTDNNREVDAKNTFDFINHNYMMVETGPTYNDKYYDHIFFNKRKMNLSKTNDLYNIIKLHKSDHEPIIVEISL